MDFDDKTTAIRHISQVAGAQEVQRVACVIVLTGHQAGCLFRIEQDESIMGRSTEAHIRIDDDGISRQHAKLYRQSNGELIIEDLQSTNGTYCNGNRINRELLQDGDKVQLGSAAVLKFTYQDPVEEDFQRRQYEMATRDGLTNCYNRKYFLERLPAEFNFAQRYKKAMAILMIDVDHFKKVNDTYGHHVGDMVLINIAQTLNNMTRKSDLLARYGGEEFIVMMREISPKDALLVADRIRKFVEHHHVIVNNQKIPVTLSCGIATYSGIEYDTVEAFSKAADDCLYEAKNNGRNRVVCTIKGQL